MSSALWYKPKLIEVALPLEDINRESAREKSIRHGHPSTLHLWWARRPLAACRAVLFAQLVDDPSAHPEQFPTEEAQKAERERLHGIISRLVVWENIHDEKLLQEAHEEIMRSTGGNPPPILDPFAGGGSIPLEAQRLGLEAHASDLNPVAVLINKALIEIPPNWAGRAPVFPGAAGERMEWPGATGLAEDVRRYGKWMRDEAEKRIGHLYPKVMISGVGATVIAWIWARTVTCPNPACAGTMPLVRSFWLAKKTGRGNYVIPIPEGKRVRFEIGGPNGVPRDGTISGRTGAVCLLCDTPVPMPYIRQEAKSGRMGAQLMAIAAEGQRQRYFAAPTEEHEKAAIVQEPPNVPDEELAIDPRNLWCVNYGLERFADLFTHRQLATLTTYSDLIKETQQKIAQDAASADYGASVATYLGFALSRTTDRNNTLCTWDAGPTGSKSSTGGSARTTTVRNAFARQALPMTWDYAEASPFSSSGGSIDSAMTWLIPAIAQLPASTPAVARQADASAPGSMERGAIVATDPPYYDNISYANLSDFFYVWLRRSLGHIYPDLLGTMVTPKADELVADPLRHGEKRAASKFFEEGFVKVFTQIREGTPSDYPISLFYAFKQSETSSDGQQASTGWETLLEGMLQAGWAVTGTWPMRTELGSRQRGLRSNALASMIHAGADPGLARWAGRLQAVFPGPADDGSPADGPGGRGSTGPGCSFRGRGDGLALVRGLVAGR